MSERMIREFSWRQFIVEKKIDVKKNRRRGNGNRNEVEIGVRRGWFE
jgi:hypothetical protein